MTKLRPATERHLGALDIAIAALKTARLSCQQADCPSLQKKIHSAIKSAGGARRHLERRIMHTRHEYAL